MPVDCLTKAMDSQDLTRALEQGVMDLHATPLSVHKKIQKANQRHNKKITVKAEQRNNNHNNKREDEE